MLLAETFLNGGGLCYDPGVDCTIRMPLYPAAVAPFIAADAAYPWLIVVQSLVDASLVWVAFAIATHLFERRVAMLAAIGTALNPYAIWHASSFQDTVLFNVLIAVGILLLISASRTGSSLRYAGAGTVLALATLTTVRMVLFLPLAVIWVAASGRSLTPGERATRASLVVVPLVLLIGGWALRNERLIGAPVLSTESGLSLWIANNPLTMTVLPQQSVDLIEEPAFAALSVEQQQAILSLERNPAAQNAYYFRLGRDYMVAHPGATAAGMQKALIGSIGMATPARDWPTQLGDAGLFLPLNALALTGLWRARRLGGGHAVVMLLVMSFVLTTAVFWSHTSHRSFLNVFEVVYASSVIAKARP